MPLPEGLGSFAERTSLCWRRMPTSATSTDRSRWGPDRAVLAHRERLYRAGVRGLGGAAVRVGGGGAAAFEVVAVGSLLGVRSGDGLGLPAVSVGERGGGRGTGRCGVGVFAALGDLSEQVAQQGDGLDSDGMPQHAFCVTLWRNHARPIGTWPDRWPPAAQNDQDSAGLHESMRRRCTGQPSSPPRAGRVRRHGRKWRPGRTCRGRTRRGCGRWPLRRQAGPRGRRPG